MTDLIDEFVIKYPQVDGIQLDDHFGMPKEMGYDKDTKALYPNPPKDETEVGWSAWVDWRVGKVTELMREICNRVKETNKNCLISLSPNPQSFSRRNYLADWSAWEKESLIEELVVQLYRDKTSVLKDELENRFLLEARDRIPTAIGILSGLRGSLRESTLIKEQTEAVRAVKFSGVSYFFYETLINKQIGSTTVARDLELSFFG